MIDRLKTDILALVLLGANVGLALSLVSYDPADPPSTLVYPTHARPVNLCGSLGASVAYELRALCGLGAWLVLAGLVVLDFRLFTRRSESDVLVRGVGTVLLVMSVCVGLRVGLPEADGLSEAGSGGYLGAWGLALLEPQFDQQGLALLLLSMGLAGLVLATDLLVFRLVWLVVAGPFFVFYRLAFGRKAEPATEVGGDAATAADLTDTDKPTANDIADSESETDEAESAWGPRMPLVEMEAEPTDGVANEEDEPEPVEDLALPPEPAPVPAPRASIRVNPPMTAVRRAVPVIEDEDEVEFALPAPDLLDEAEEFPYEFLAERARIAAGTLEKTFNEFGLNVKVVEIDTGPVITQYELELEAGLRLSKVTALADDLAIALRVPSVRVVAPIPGKNTVGVEVPNDRRVMVRLRELLETSPELRDKLRIPIFLGKDVSGRPLAVDMAKMPHLLIAGRTGTGKSVCLNTLILSILMTRSPDDVKMIMIDPKMVELSPYMRVPHLMHPVITDMKKAEAVLGWAVDKMEERYDLLARCGVRHLDSYNQLTRAQKLQRLELEDDSEEGATLPDRMPYIVIIADEFADLIMTSGKEVEGHIIRLAQKSRAVGIHLVLATQKPTVDVITGLIKSNLPARISFQVASRVDSRVVLDEMGAEKLLGNGDMLYLAPGTSKITRAQGTYVSDDEVMRVIEFYGDCPPQYSKELTQLKTSPSSGKNGIEAIRARDELYERACEIVIREGRGSTSLLQRAMGIGYGRAARLIDYMAEDGIVGDYAGSQAREVMMTIEDWQALVGGEPVEA